MFSCFENCYFKGQSSSNKNEIKIVYKSQLPLFNGHEHNYGIELNKKDKNFKAI